MIRFDKIKFEADLFEKLPLKTRSGDILRAHILSLYMRGGKTPFQLISWTLYPWNRKQFLAEPEENRQNILAILQVK